MIGCAVEIHVLHSYSLIPIHTIRQVLFYTLAFIYTFIHTSARAPVLLEV